MACNTMSCKKLYSFRERYFRRETFSATVCRSPINRMRVSFILFFSFSYSSLSFPVVTATSLHYRTLSPRKHVSQSTSTRPNLDSSLCLSHRSDQIRRNWFTRDIFNGRTHNSYFFKA